MDRGRRGRRVRLVAPFDREIASVTEFLSQGIELDSGQAQRVVGGKPCPTGDAIVDCAKSPIDFKLARG